MLTDRQKAILRLVVNNYIWMAEPVGSRIISKQNSIGYSPATIRNEMADLEEMGYLQQPHTSAGRIPSEKGYRFYVDNLIEPTVLTKQQKQQIKQTFVEKLCESEQVIQQTAAILSSLTNYTSIVLGSEVFETSLKHMQLIPLSDRQAVAIIVTNTGHVENKKVTIPEGISLSDIERLVNLLNAKLRNVPLFQLKFKLYNEIGEELQRHMQYTETMLHFLDQILVEQEERLVLSGTTKMLTQPEFQNMEKVKMLLDILEEQDGLLELLGEKHSSVQVRIGRENGLEAFYPCSVVTASYYDEGRPIVTIGILGPTRMHYDRVIGLLQSLTDEIGHWIIQ